MGLFELFRRNKNGAKTSNQPTAEPTYTESNSHNVVVDETAAALLSSPYYTEYETLFQFIIQDGNQPRYKVDFLLESLDMGRQLTAEEGRFYIRKSVEENLPYFCETESEFDLFFDSRAPVLKGSIEGILNMLSFYFYSEKHSAKQKYWLERLQQQAQTENFEAQAVLCTNRVRNFFSELELVTFKETYEANLMQLAEAGNAMAQLAVGEFLVSRPPVKIEWLTKAAQQGLSDAWYHLGNTYSSMINIDDDGNFSPNRLSQDEINQLMIKETECFLNGAKVNNGIMAAWCQYKVGDRFAEGHCLPKDLVQAVYWMREALKNGEEMAKGHLEYIERMLSEQ